VAAARGIPKLSWTQQRSALFDDLIVEDNQKTAGMRFDQARADLNTITGLTAKNRNIPQRATIYAKIAEAEMRQQLYSDALQHIGQAISMDNSNLSFYMQRGDINVAAGNLSAALGNYDEAIGRGRNDGEAWKARTTRTAEVGLILALPLFMICRTKNWGTTAPFRSRSAPTNTCA